MEYTVQRLARLAGVSPRTLRYYDQIGLLAPARMSSSGYRIYGGGELERLQQILFYRELGVSLEEIAGILEKPEFDSLAALKSHREQLRQKRDQIEALIQTVEKTIASKERGIIMKDSEKFEGFKKKLVEENEEKYGAEIREKYGEEVVNESNRKMMNLTKEQYDEMQAMAAEILQLIDKAYETGEPAGESAQKAAALHKDWLTYTWKEYSKEAHAGLGQMYAADERFSAYYDRGVPGKAAFFRDAIAIFTGRAT